jgi:hypothetical protein
MAAGVIAGAAAGKAVASEAAGVIKGVINALEKPIWSNVETTTVTHVAQNGDVITRTRTKGFTIPLGVPVLVVGSIMAWEVGNFIGQGLAKVAGVVPNINDLMNPSNWGGTIVSSAQGQLNNIANAAGSTGLGPLSGAWLAQQAISYFSPGKAPSSLPAGQWAYARPSSAMASLSNLVQNFVDPIAATAGSYGPSLIKALSQQ